MVAGEVDHDARATPLGGEHGVAVDLDLTGGVGVAGDGIAALGILHDEGPADEHVVAVARREARDVGGLAVLDVLRVGDAADGAGAALEGDAMRLGRPHGGERDDLAVDRGEVTILPLMVAVQW